MNIIKKLLIICIISIIIVAAVNVYNDIILPNMYGNDSVGQIVEEEEIHDLCMNAVIKYLTGVQSNINNIKEFYTSFKFDSEKSNIFKSNLDNLQTIKLGKVYKINNTTYIVEYSIKNLEDKYYKCILKFYNQRNYYKVLYDELYESKKEV